MRKINFDEVSLKGYVTSDTNKIAIRYNPHPKIQDGSEPPLKNVLKLCLMVGEMSLRAYFDFRTISPGIS